MIGNFACTALAAIRGRAEYIFDRAFAGWETNFFQRSQARQLVDQYSLETECTGNVDAPARKLCVIAFLPHILDSGAAGRKAYIQASLPSSI